MTDDHSAIDLSDMSLRVFKSYTLKDDKENAHSTKNLGNVSMTSLGAGILSEAQLNISHNGMLSSASFFNPNESFDCEKIKLDAYEKSVAKLENENKSLRKRVKKLTEVARANEQEILDSIGSFTLEKQKLEEKNQKEYE